MQAVLQHPGGVAKGIASESAQEEIALSKDEIEGVIRRSTTLSAFEGLSIYSRAYRARLLECLRVQYPVSAHALGAELFDQFALAYLERYPSRNYTLDRLGENFPRYLGETRPEDHGSTNLPPDWPDFVIDLATLERTLFEVFDAPGNEGQKPPFDASKLAVLPSDRLLSMRVSPAGSLRLLALRYPVNRYFQSVRRREEPDPVTPGEYFVAVSRKDYEVKFHELVRPAYELLTALAAGATIRDAIQQGWSGENRDRALSDVVQLVGNWMDSRFFDAIHLKGGDTVNGGRLSSQ